jgi:hypothetical protein
MTICRNENEINRFSSGRSGTDRVQRFEKGAYQTITEIQSSTGEMQDPEDATKTVETITITRFIAESISF